MEPRSNGKEKADVPIAEQPLPDGDEVSSRPTALIRADRSMGNAMPAMTRS